MRILHYFDRVRLEEGGTIRAALDMSTAMARLGHGVTMLTYDDTDAPTEWKTSDAGASPRVVLIEPPARPGRFFSRAQLARIAGHVAGADVVHLHGMWVPSNPQVAALCRRNPAGGGVPVPYVVSIHGMLDDWGMRQRGLKKKIYLALQGNAMLRHAAALHTTAEGEREQSSTWMPGGRWVVVPYIVDLSPFRALPGPGEARAKFGIADSAAGGEPSVLFLSRLHYKKCPDILIRASALLRDRGVKHRLLLAGTGDTEYVESLKRLAAELNLADRCVFLGMVTGPLKLSVYEASDVFALPTSQENFGLVFAESLACRTPVVGTKGTDIWRELESSGGAVIADRTPEAFADALAGVLADPGRRRAMGESGRRWVFEALDEARIGAEFEKMYAGAAAAANPAGAAALS
jgi:glycosyltransferase involved in cell wall biosynthesis